MLGRVQEVSAGRPGVGTGRPPGTGHPPVACKKGSSTYFKGPPVHNRTELPAYRVRRLNTSSSPGKSRRAPKLPRIHPHDECLVSTYSMHTRGVFVTVLTSILQLASASPKGTSITPRLRPPGRAQGGAGSDGEGSGCKMGSRTPCSLLPHHPFPVLLLAALSISFGRHNPIFEGTVVCHCK